ncbi:MAG: hypothetical protein FWH40_01180 [Coriobacteriia bacterium]|nr:hypothetical protein [Coriobacteriia bacterium]
MKAEVSISTIAELVDAIQNLTSDVDLLALRIVPGDLSDYEADSITSVVDLATMPAIETLYLDIEGKRSDYAPDIFVALLERLSSFYAITELKLRISSEGPALIGLPAFANLEHLTLGASYHPLDGLPMFPSLKSVETSEYMSDSGDYTTWYTAESENALLQMLPRIWPSPDYYEDLKCEESDFFIIKSILQNWPVDQKIPINIKYKDPTDEFTVHSYMITKDQVLVQDEVDAYPRQEGFYTLIKAPQWQFGTSDDNSGSVRCLNIEEAYLEKLVLGKAGVFLEYRLLEYDLCVDNDGPDPTFDYAYLPVCPYKECYDGIIDRSGEWQHQFVFQLTHPQKPSA